MRLPLLDMQINPPTRGSLAWYGTLGVMTAVGVIEWPLGVVVAAGHLIAENSRSSTVAAAGESAESAAG